MEKLVHQFTNQALDDGLKVGVVGGVRSFA